MYPPGPRKGNRELVWPKRGEVYQSSRADRIPIGSLGMRADRATVHP